MWILNHVSQPSSANTSEAHDCCELAALLAHPVEFNITVGGLLWTARRKTTATSWHIIPFLLGAAHCKTTTTPHSEEP